MTLGITLRDTVAGVVNVGHFPETCYVPYPRDVEKTHSNSNAEVMRWQRPWGQGSTVYILDHEGPMKTSELGAMAQRGSACPVNTRTRVQTFSIHVKASGGDRHL